jgi:hypothetical protein
MGMNEYSLYLDTLQRFGVVGANHCRKMNQPIVPNETRVTKLSVEDLVDGLSDLLFCWKTSFLVWDSGNSFWGFIQSFLVVVALDIKQESVAV